MLAFSEVLFRMEFASFVESLKMKFLKTFDVLVVNLNVLLDFWSNSLNK